MTSFPCEPPSLLVPSGHLLSGSYPPDPATGRAGLSWLPARTERVFGTFGRGASREILMFVYVLQSLANQSHYIGISAKPNERLAAHNRGEVRSTKRHRPWKRIYLEECDSMLAARTREKYLKSAAGRRFRRSLHNRAVSSVG